MDIGVMVDFDPGIGNRKAPPIGAMNFVIITLIIAVIGIVCLLVGIDAGATLFGAFGLVLGGYSMGYVHRHGDNRKDLLALSGAALFISVIAFMLGFVSLLS